MEQIKPLSPNIKDIRTLVYEINRSNDTLMTMLNSLIYKDTGESLNFKEETPKYHLFGGSRNTSFSARYFVIGESAGHDLVPNNSIYTTGNNTYWIKDDTGVSREIASTGEGGAFLPIDGKAADSELLDGLDSSYFTPLNVFNSHTLDGNIHFEEDEINHNNIINKGTNTHAQIDSHISNSDIHFLKSSIDHGAISGLTDDDHLQYHTDARGDVRYLQLSGGSLTGGLDSTAYIASIDFVEGGFSLSTKYLGISAKAADSDLLDGNDSTYYATASGLSTHVSDASIHFTEASIDHGSIAGLADDDHTQYYNQTRGDARYLQINATSQSSYELARLDTRNDVTLPDYGSGTSHHFKYNTTDGLSDGGIFHTIHHIEQWLHYSGGRSHQIGYTDNGNMWHRLSNDTRDGWEPWYKLWHSGNDGSGSTLDADLLDGNHGAYYAPLSTLTTHTSDSSIHFTESSIDHGSISGLADDDHTQYYNQSRGDARYARPNVTNTWTARQDIDSFYWYEGSRYINSDPRWDGGLDTGRIHWWSTTNAGAQYGQFGHALWNGSTYTYIDTISGANGIRVTDKVEAYNSGSEGSYIGLFKGTGSLPGYPASRFPTLKTNNTTLFFSANERYSGYFQDLSDTHSVFVCRSSNTGYAALHGEKDGYSGLSCKYRTSAGISSFNQNASGGAIELKNAAGTTNCLVRSYGVSYFNGGNVGIGTSSPSSALDVIGDVEISGSIQQESWTDATLATGWSNKGTPYSNVRYRKDKEGYLRISGVLSSTPANGDDPMFTLPVGYRPTYEKIIGLMTNSGTIKAYVRTTGIVQLAADVSVVDISFDGTIVSLD